MLLSKRQLISYTVSSFMFFCDFWLLYSVAEYFSFLTHGGDVSGDVMSLLSGISYFLGITTGKIFFSSIFTGVFFCLISYDQQDVYDDDIDDMEQRSVVFRSNRFVKNSVSSRSFYPRMSVIDHMEGHDFERFCAKVMRNNGFKNVSVTPGSRDQGLDIIAYKDDEKWGIQCKRHKNNIGNKAVQEAYTGKAIYDCDHVAVMTNSRFTDGGIQAAVKTGVLLWDRSKLIEMMGH